MFERFSDRARRVVVMAQAEARELDHDSIGTEHILLGLLRVDDGVAALTLAGLGVDHDSTRARVVELVGTGENPGGEPGQIPFTTRAKKILELALRESLEMGVDFIGTEHMLLGLLREGEGIGARVLVGLDAGLPRVREALAAQGVHARPPRDAVEHEPEHGGDDVADALAALTRRLEAIEIRLTAIEDRLDR